MFSRMKEAFKREDGMVDLASVITGVIVSGILGVVVAASVIVVIPWFQDKAAENDFNLIKIAEDAHYSDTSKYGDMNALYNGRYLHKSVSPSCVFLATPNSPDYTIYVQSKSGKKLSYSPANLKSTTVTSFPCTLITK